MSEYLVSWVLGPATGFQSARLDNPTWDDVAEALGDVQEYDGVVTLDKLGAPKIGPKSLQVRTEDGYSVLTLGEDTEGDYIVRAFSNANAHTAMVEILGDSWDLRLVCTDFDLVIQAFREFYDSGDVSRQLLS